MGVRQSVQKFFKELPRVTDRLRVQGGLRNPDFRGMRMPDGSPVPVELIMETYGVDRPAAEKISQRNSR